SSDLDGTNQHVPTEQCAWYSRYAHGYQQRGERLRRRQSGEVAGQTRRRGPTSAPASNREVARRTPCADEPKPQPIRHLLCGGLAARVKVPCISPPTT